MDKYNHSLLDILQNPKNNMIKLDNAKNYFNKFLTKKILADSFIKIFNEYKYIKERWKD